MVESADHGFEVFVRSSSGGDHLLDVAQPGQELVMWENHTETASVDGPAQDILYFDWEAFGLEFFRGEEGSACDGFRCGFQHGGGW